MNILVVDDSKATLEIVRRALMKFDYRRLEIKKLDNPLEALSLLKSWQPDIILTDWHMPEMSGLEFIQAVMKLDLAIKVGMITTVDDELMVRQAKQAGASFVLAKPFDDAELHRHLLRVVQETEDAQIIPDHDSGGYSEGIALPKLPQLEKLLKKVIGSSVRINKIHPQAFDNSKLPCLAAIYIDEETHKTRAVALLDIYAICVFSSRNPDLNEQRLKSMMLEKNVEDEVLATCKKVLVNTSLAFLDQHSRKSLKLKSLNVFHDSFEKLEALFNAADGRRIDFSCQVEGLAQGKVTMIGF
ncbi:response regulator [Vibrio sp.]|nr:response regulator [Vibrio sp.]